MVSQTDNTGGWQVVAVLHRAFTLVFIRGELFEGFEKMSDTILDFYSVTLAAELRI